MRVDKTVKFVTLLLHAKWVRVRFYDFFFVMIKSVRDSVIHSLLVNYHLPYYSLKFVAKLFVQSCQCIKYYVRTTFVDIF